MVRILYVTSDELIEYAASRGVSISSEEALVLINNAQDYIDTMYTFCGTAVYKSSAFPRSGLKDYDNTTIPYAVKAATLYAALQIQIGTPFTAGKKAAPQVKKVTIGTGSISREYATNTKNHQYKKLYIYNTVPSCLMTMICFATILTVSVICTR